MYVFDTSSFIELFKFYPKRFPSLWKNIDRTISDGKIISVLESFHEIETRPTNEELEPWIKANREIFLAPGVQEALFMQDMYKVKKGHFKTMVETKKILKGGRCADPFLVAKASITKRALVTQEIFKEHSAKLPNVCEHFNIDCCNLEEFMERENWTF
ncbi:MAG: DUF4411 family protein [Legionellales bacterium]|nr:DUF4411 family protein [Legionellales bacterium]